MDEQKALRELKRRNGKALIWSLTAMARLSILSSITLAAPSYPVWIKKL